MFAPVWLAGFDRLYHSIRQAIPIVGVNATLVHIDGTACGFFGRYPVHAGKVIVGPDGIGNEIKDARADFRRRERGL
jgi:hypothetical protein